MGDLLNFVNSVIETQQINMINIGSIEANRATVVDIIEEMNDMGLLITQRVDAEKFLDKNNRMFYYDKTIKVNNTLENFGEFKFNATYKSVPVPGWIWINFAIYKSDELMITDSSEYSVVD